MSQKDETPVEGGAEDASSVIAAVQLRSSVLELLAHYEDQLLLLQSSGDDDETPVPEILEEEKARLRESLYESLRHTFLRAENPKGQVGVEVYEQIVYSHSQDRLKKAVAFYQALSRFQEEVRRTSQDLGDPKGIEVPLHDIQKLLLSLDEVDFVRKLGTSLGVYQGDLDRIVDHMIVREFAPLRRREVSEIHEGPREAAIGRSKIRDDE